MHYTLSADGHEVKITPRLNDTLADVLKKALSYTPAGSEWSPNHFNNQWRVVNGKRQFNPKARWDGSVSLFKKNNRHLPNSFPYGLLETALEALQKASPTDTFELVKLIPLHKPEDITLNNKKVVLKGQEITIEVRDYQQQTVEALLTRSHAMAEVATGGGKSIIIGELLSKFPSLRRLVTVPSKSLMHQTAADLEGMLGVPVGRWGDGKKDLQNVTVAIIDSVARNIDKQEIVDFLSGVEMWVCDESHLSAADKYKDVDKLLFNTSRRYGVSATLMREDNAELIFHGMFGPCVVKFPAAELIKRGWLVKPRIQIHVVEHNFVHEGEKKKPSFDDVYATDITYSMDRNTLIGELARRCKEENMWPCLILVSDLAHGENLQDIISRYGKTAFLQGDTLQKVRNEVLNMVKNAELPFLVASTIFDIGVDIPQLRSVILAGSGKSQSRAVQRVGRGLRHDHSSPVSALLGPKEEVLVIDFEDREKYFLRDHSLLRRSYYNIAYPGCVTTWKNGVKLQDFGNALI